MLYQDIMACLFIILICCNCAENSRIKPKEHFTTAAQRKYGSLGTSHSRDWNAEVVNRLLLNVTPACSFHFFSMSFVVCYKVWCRHRTGWQGGWWKAFLRGFLDLSGWARKSSQRAECRDAQNQRQCPGAGPHTLSIARQQKETNNCNVILRSIDRVLRSWVYRCMNHLGINHGFNHKHVSC